MELGEGLLPLSLMGLKCLRVSGADNGEAAAGGKQEEGKARTCTSPTAPRFDDIKWYRKC